MIEIMLNDYMLELKNVKKYFKVSSGWLHAVDNVNLAIEKSTTLGVVGESGCGKSTLGRVAMRLLEATDGQVIYKGENILEYNRKQILEIRKSMQLIFQDPYSSLNPRMSVSELIAEPIKVNMLSRNRTELNKRVEELLDTVGLTKRFANSYPHELDGGRRQRVGIARAIALNPEFIVCDEPVSALDVSIQAQILNLLMDLQDEKKLTYMFITHNLSVVKHISSQIAVLYLGHCVEKATTKELFASPLHPYSQSLLEAIPLPSLKGRRTSKKLLIGEVRSPINPQPGCRFAPRCSQVNERCKGYDIPLKEISPGHFVACTLYE